MADRVFVIIKNLKTGAFPVQRQVSSLDQGVDLMFRLQDKPPYNDNSLYKAAVVSTSHPTEIPLNMVDA